MNKKLMKKNLFLKENSGIGTETPVPQLAFKKHPYKEIKARAQHRHETNKENVGI